MSLPVKITYLEKLEHPHENASMKTGALNRSATSEMSIFSHRPSEGRATQAQPNHQIRQFFGRFGGLSLILWSSEVDQIFDYPFL